MKRLEICNLAGDIQDTLIQFIQRVNDSDIEWRKLI